MRKLAGFFHWKDQDRATKRFIDHHRWQRESRGVFYQPLPFLLKCCAEAVCTPPGLSPTPQMISESSAITGSAIIGFPLSQGHTVFPAVRVSCEMNSHPAPAQVFGAECFFVFFSPWQIQLWKSVWSFIEFDLRNCNVSRLLGSQSDFDCLSFFFCCSCLSTLVLHFSAQSLVILFLFASSAFPLLPPIFSYLFQFILLKPFCPECGSPLLLPHLAEKEHRPFMLCEWGYSWTQRYCMQISKQTQIWQILRAEQTAVAVGQSEIV